MSVDWRLGGVMLGLVFFVALALVKPVGVSTEFVVADGVIAQAVTGDTVYRTAEGAWTSDNGYFAKYARSIANPLGYGTLFVIFMAIGAGVSSFVRGGTTKAERRLPAIWRANYGTSDLARMAAAFAGGFLALFGARLAGGCTSGHMMSGMSQTSVSGFLFALGAFAVAVPTAMLLYKREN